MNTLEDSADAASSHDCAVRAIDAYFLEHVTGTDGRATIPIRVALGDIIVEHLVSATVSQAGARSDPDVLDIAWVPTHASLYPAFQGTLRVVPAGADACRLVLHGTYAPPLGRPGAMFDAILGRRVAHATLCELLDRFRGRAEAAFLATPHR